MDGRTAVKIQLEKMSVFPEKYKKSNQNCVNDEFQWGDF